MMEDKPKEILELERALGIDQVDYYKWDGEQVVEMAIRSKGLRDISALTKFTSLESLDLMDNNLIDISPIKNLINLKYLNLGLNKIITLDSLDKLTNLESLGLWSNNIKLVEPLRNLTSLRSLSLQNNKISEINELGYLVSLESLYISRNRNLKISPIGKLLNLINLDLSNNEIDDISCLSTLSKLESLFLNDNLISKIDSLSSLKFLRSIYLTKNHVSELQVFSDLHSLEILHLDKNKITNLNGLNNLKKLKILNLNHNKIHEISPLQNLKYLELLALEYNEIRELHPIRNLNLIQNLGLKKNKIQNIEPLSDLINLTTLFLNDNLIKDISHLKNLSNLNLIDLRNNFITDILPIKGLVSKFKKITFDDFSTSEANIFIGGNPIENPSIEIINQGNKAILEFFDRIEKEREKGERPINEAKLIIIGEPRSGKTTLMNYLLDKPYKDHASTQGFIIEQWKITQNFTNYRINIWDFGGQDIQSTVHQFFLTQDTLYIIFLNAASDEQPDKYIEQIKSYAPDSPILIIANKIEDNPPYEMGVKRLQEIHKDKEGNSLIKGVFKVSLLKGHKELDPSYFPILEEMKQAIQKTLLEMPNIHRSVPITYLDVKEYLESAFFADKPYISHDSYKQICREKGLEVESDADLLQRLNNLGTVRYFDELKLSYLQILNPQWLSDGVYRILVSERTKQLRGIITEKDFETILQKTEEHMFEYPKHHYNYLIQMIRKFDIGYQDEHSGKIFIPRAFGIDYVQAFDASMYKNEAIHFFFRYESFIPSTLMPAFITRMFGMVKDQLYSQNGVVLQQNGQFALVEQTTIKNRIDIWVSGDKSKGEYYEFFLEIRKVFRKFHEKRPGLVVDEMIGLGKNSDISVKYKQLIAFKIKKENDYIGEDGIRYNIDELLGRFESKNNTVQYITEQHNYNVSGDLYSGQIFLIKQDTNELIELIKQNKANFTKYKQAEIEKMISELENAERALTDRSAAKGVFQQLNETRKNLLKISSEEAVKWFTKSALDGKFNETFMKIAKKVMLGFQNPMIRDFVDNGSNMM